ncbi:MAG TPA: UDP-3-O-(3-hydroxymyristoyl)glucosamine N-acyltransferase [Blastocatellia bacterium]|nr:UDP-3-O-(3-hydroxymyristoyl)glucosamine N-acyltransferase [Blastocatellia bacterium]
MKLNEIAERLKCELEGDGTIDISGVATLESAQTGQLSFLTNAKYHNEAKSSSASAIIVDADCPPMGMALLRSGNPYLAFAKAIEIFCGPRRATPGVHPTAWISDSASVGNRVSIGAFAYIGHLAMIEDDVSIGSHCAVHEGARVRAGAVLHSGCVIREDVEIGERCVIQNNAVIGSDGFGYAKTDDGAWYPIPQTGGVVIEAQVDVGACSTIDRAALGETRISGGTKLDNLVQIGHGCTVGPDGLICAQVGLAGSTRVGRNVILTGQVGVAGHLTIGDGAIATPQTGVASSVEPGSIISGAPAIDHKKWLKSSAVIARLPEIHRAVRDLEKRLRRLEAVLNVQS